MFAALAPQLFSRTQQGILPAFLILHVTMADYATNPFSRTRSTVTFRITPAMRDFWAFTLWVLVTFVQFKNDELILYPLAVYFVYAIWRDQRLVVPLLVRGWIPLVFAGWCLISPIWAVEPVTALKIAVYLILTLMICFHAAAVLSARQVMYAVVLATGFIGLLSLFLLLSGQSQTSGVFPQKNAMGKSMIMLWTAAFAVAIDPGSSRKVRYGGLVMALLAFYLGIRSESATAVLLMIANGGILMLGSIVLKGGINRPSRLALTFVLFAGGFLSAAIILPTFQGDPVEIVLEQFGKDSTLTGRTGLWDYAEEQIKEAPVLGVGSGGFWRYQSSPLVQKIYEEYHRGVWDQFNFHNSYYEITVHQGYIGLVLAVTAIIWAWGIIIRGAFRFATIPFIFFFAQSGAVLARTFTESDFLRPFVLFHMLFWIGALIVLKEELRARPKSQRTRLQARLRRSLLRR